MSYQSENTKLCRDAKNLRHRNDQRNQHKCLCRARRNEKVHDEHDEIDEKYHRPLGHCFRKSHGFMEDCVQHLSFFKGVFDGGRHASKRSRERIPTPVCALARNDEEKDRVS